MSGSRHMPGKRRGVPIDEAIKRLGDKDTIHALTSPDSATLLGADWDRQDVIDAMTKHGVEEAGAGARSMGHTLCVLLPQGWFFFEASEAA